MSAIRICIVDDHRLFRKGLRMLLSIDHEIEVVGEAANADEALKTIGETIPDIVLLDLAMPGIGFQEMIKQIRTQYPAVRILVLTMHDDVEYAKAALAAGAASYLTKSSAESELLATVKAVHEGRAVVSLNSLANLTEKMLTIHPNGTPVTGPHSKLLTTREQSVLQLAAQGFTSAEIAEKLFLSVKTIDTYRSRLMSKLNLKTRADLVSYAKTHRLLDTQSVG
jgi:DNA-binding NarL/FixJ family response regulator